MRRAAASCFAAARCAGRTSGAVHDEGLRRASSVVRRATRDRQRRAREDERREPPSGHPAMLSGRVRDRFENPNAPGGRERRPTARVAVRYHSAMVQGPPSADTLAAMMPFTKKCGVVLTRATASEVEGELAWAADVCTAGGVMHGGALMTLVDSVAAACACLNLPPGAGTTTIESKINLFRAVRRGTARATATPVHVGRTIVVIQTDVRDDDGKRVALAMQTQAVLAGG